MTNFKNNLRRRINVPETSEECIFDTTYVAPLIIFAENLSLRLRNYDI